MEALVTVKNHLSFERYLNLNLYLLVRRRALQFVAVLFLIVLAGYYMVEPQERGDSFIWLIVFYIVYFLSIPLVVYLGARKNYKKIKSMSEPKTYEFYDNEVKIIGETVNMAMDWGHIDKIIARKDDLLVFTANNRNFFVLPLNGFSDESDVEKLTSLIEAKRIKNNFK